MDKTDEMKSQKTHEMYPEKYSKETFIEELKSSDPDKMSWLMLNYLVQKMAETVQHDGESTRYSGARYSDSMHDMSENEHHENKMMHHENKGNHDSSYRMRNYSRYSYDEEICKAKERIGEAIGHNLDDEEIKCMIVKEAASLIKKISECKPYEAMKEFEELCMAMKGYSENHPEELEEQAKQEAISGYARMFLGGHSYRSRSIDFEDREKRKANMLPVIEIEEYGRRGRSRDAMGRYK